MIEAAAMARAVRSNFESSPDDADTKRLAMMVGGGVVAVVAVIVLGFKLFGSKAEAPRPAPPSPVVQAPQYPQEVIGLVAKIETELQADDLKGVRADVDKLRQVSPSHPRLAFFEGLLSQRGATAKGTTSSAAGRGTAKRSGSRRGGSNDTTATPAGPATPTAFANTVAPTASANAPAPTPSANTATAASSPPRDGPKLAPETPPGLTRPAAASEAPAASTRMATTAAPTSAPTDVSPPAPTDAPTSASSPAPSSPGSAASTSVASAAPSSAAPSSLASAAPAAVPSSASTSTPTPRRPSAGEPPPVIQEAKLIRRVDPEYPSAAKHDGVIGSVDLEVTVSPRGVVQNVTVVSASPPQVFEKSATAAVRKWKYDPRFIDGLPSEAHLKVHLEFAPDK